MTGERASDNRPAIRRSPRATLEHYAAEAALAHTEIRHLDGDPRNNEIANLKPVRYETDIVYWVGTDEGRLGAFDSYEEACTAAGPCAVGWSEVRRDRARQLVALGTEAQW